MSIVDNLLGRGSLDARFTDWDTARNFVIFDTIVNNPRLTDETKIELQNMEEQAYQSTHGQFFKTETTEIAEYYNYLKNNFPSITDDKRFLSIFDAADSVKAQESSLSLEDLEPSNEVKLGLVVLGLAGLTLFVLTRD